MSGQLWVLLLRMREECASIWLMEPVAVPTLHPSPEDSEVPPVLELLVVVERTKSQMNFAKQQMNYILERQTESTLLLVV